MIGAVLKKEGLARPFRVWRPGDKGSGLRSESRPSVIKFCYGAGFCSLTPLGYAVTSIKTITQREFSPAQPRMAALRSR